MQKTGRKDLFPKDKNSKPSKKTGKGKKLPNKHSGITDTMAAYALLHEGFPFHYEERLQQVFHRAAILPSLENGLIPKDGLTLSGDGTCVHSHASSYGHKVCKCPVNGIRSCSCKRHFSGPDAHWGWDSDEEIFYFGHTLYMLCFHNADIGTDLPLHLRFLDARRHDSVSLIVSLREFCSSSSYGRCVYTKPDWDIRLYTPVPRGTEEYKKIYNNRTYCERLNNRVLNDYHLHDMGIHTRKRYSFFTMFICICIHLDAQLKKRTKQKP